MQRTFPVQRIAIVSVPCAISRGPASAALLADFKRTVHLSLARVYGGKSAAVPALVIPP